MNHAAVVPTAVPVEDEPHRDLRRTGQPLPSNWREAFLEHYQEHGTFWKACKAAGVNASTVERHRHADPAFAHQIEDARQEFADSQELSLKRIGDNGNPVGPIVLLKKHRPAEFIEKAVSMNISVTTQLEPEAGHQLLQAMLGSALPSTRQALTEGDKA